MHRVAADKFIVNITFAWEHAVAITDENDAGLLVSHRFPQFSFGEEMKSHFFKYVMLDRKFREHLELSSPGGAGRNRVLKIDDMLKYNIKFPSIAEQIKIGEYFDNLDNLITLHQRKYQILELCKLFDSEIKCITWKQRKLSDCAAFRRGSFPQPYGNKEWYDGEGAMPFVQVADVADDMRLVDETKQKISKLAQPMSVYADKESVLVTLQGSIGRVAITQYGAFVDRTVLIFDKYNEDINKIFWAYIIKEKFIEEAKRAPGGTIKTITKEVLSDFDLIIPSYNEQAKIASYFEQIDNLITLHQRKCYDDISDWYAWKQRKFSDFTFPAGKRNKENLDLEPYAITNEHGFIPQNEAHDDFGYMKDTDRKAYNIVAPFSFAYNPARINVGSIGYYDGAENVIVSSLYEVFQTAEDVDDRFLWHWFKSDDFPKWIERLQEGSVRLYFYYDKLCECKMMMPSIEEQRKIADSLDNLDNLITLHRRKYL